MFGDKIKMYSQSTQLIEHEGTHSDDKLVVHSVNGKVQIEDVVFNEKHVSGVGSMNVDVTDQNNVGLSVTAHLSPNEDMVIVQNYERSMQYFKVDRNGTVRIGGGLQEKPITIFARGSNASKCRTG